MVLLNNRPTEFQAMTQQAKSDDEFAWLIERGDSESCAPTYWAGPSLSTGSYWSQDHMDAVRFARKQDAERVACKLGEGYHRVCEHGWLMKPQSPPTEAAPMKIAETIIDGQSAVIAKMQEALRIADDAINPKDRSGISLHTWDKRLKEATAKIREVLSSSTEAAPMGEKDPSLLLKWRGAFTFTKDENAEPSPQGIDVEDVLKDVPWFISQLKEAARHHGPNEPIPKLEEVFEGRVAIALSVMQALIERQAAEFREMKQAGLTRGRMWAKTKVRLCKAQAEIVALKKELGRE